MSGLIKYTILEVLSEDDCTSEYESMSKRGCDYTVVRVSCIVKSCNGKVFEQTTNWLKTEWEEKKKAGYYFIPEYFEDFTS